MPSERFRLVNELLLRALELEGQERAAFLEAECRGDLALREEIEGLLAANRDLPSILATEDTGEDEPPETGTTRVHGSDRVGPYHLLERLGEGGFGEVYVAQQTAPVRRRVALKILKAGLDTKTVLARFEAERQALAMMDHPNIARVLDAGETDRGRPYFVMELIHGEPITAYCDRYRLRTRERLELFGPICRAIHHAHQKGVIHRDLKPSNVLVTVIDGKAVPKVIDFGIAKAISSSSSLTDMTLHTLRGQMIGTPAYMSPEQAEMTGLDVDTTTDVYSLGVLLYEILTGALPFDTKALLEAGYDAMRQIIREVEPQKPSTRVSSLGAAVTSVAERRRTEPVALERQLRGELDWITMMAMDKDPTRRYPSPSELAADIDRHLKHEPVVASLPSTRYRVAKFVRRHRLAVTATATLLVLLTGFAVAMTIQASRIAQERDRANREAEASRRVSEFLTNLFKVSDPSKARGNSVTAREILDRGAEEMRDSLKDQPEVRAQLMGTMGGVYRELGLYEPAAALLEEALEIQRRVLDADDPAIASSMYRLGVLYWRQGRFEEAAQLHEEALEARRRVLGPEDPKTLASTDALAAQYKNLGRYEEAEALDLETLEIRRRVLGDEDSGTLNSMNNLAVLYLDQGRYDEAEPLFVETLEVRRRVWGADDPQTFSATNNLAVLYQRQGRYEESEPLYVDCLEATRRVYGDEHPETLRSLNSLASLYTFQGRYDDAEPLHRQVLETSRRVMGEEHPTTLRAMNDLADLNARRGRYAEAEALYLEALEGRRRALGEEHQETLQSMAGLGVLYHSWNREADAERFSLQALEARRRVLGEEHPETLASLNNLANVYGQQGRYEEAASLYREALETQRRTLGDDHPNTLTFMSNLAYLVGSHGEYEEAEALFRKALETQRRVLGEDHASTLTTAYNFACVLTFQGRSEEALALLRDVVDRGFTGADPVHDPDLATLHGDPEFEAIVAAVNGRNENE